MYFQVVHLYRTTHFQIKAQMKIRILLTLVIMSQFLAFKRYLFVLRFR